MDIFQTFSLILFITAILSFFNSLYSTLPTSIGLMVTSLMMAVCILVLGQLGVTSSYIHMVEEALNIIQFDLVLMRGMLGVLLFAAALHVNFNDLLRHRWAIGLLATLGVVFTAFLVGTCMFFVSGILNLNLSFLDCLIFGALISPTDPIAVLSVLKAIGAPHDLEVKITGESLFNDGVGVVLFSILLGLSSHSMVLSVQNITWLFLKEAIGGVIFGSFIGYLAYQMLRRIDDYVTEILITLSVVFTGCVAAESFHLSAPIAAVSAGLFIGNHGRNFNMDDKQTKHLDLFWHLMDEIFNSVLFVLLGFELLVITFNMQYIFAGFVAVLIVLLSRFVGVASIIGALRFHRDYSFQSIKMLTWGGLKGGISIALALSLPETLHRELMLTMTFIVVIFSVLVQGTTIQYLFYRKRNNLS